MSKFKTRLKHEAVECIHQLVLKTVGEDPKDDEDRLYKSVLFEIGKICYKKLGDSSKDYSFTFTAPQAIAFRMFCIQHGQDVTTYIGNRLHTLATEIHKQYN